MSGPSRPVPAGAADDIWHLHEAQIKDLYQKQRKTLPEVKRLMEESGFPETPLSTWESKLRERLQLRKKAKSHNWPLIYRHIRPRLEHPRKKQFKRQTIICLNGSEIPWNKAWKEIRRSGALANDSNSTPPSPLPPEITIRSPSPGSFTPAPGPRSARAMVSDLTTPADRTAALAVVPLQTSVVVPAPQARSLTYSLSVYLLQWCASTISWLEMCESIQHMFREGKHTRRLELSFSLLLNEFLATSAIARAARSQIRNENISSEPRLDLLRNNRPIPPRPSPDLGYRVAKSRGQIQLSQFIATAVFLLSNRLHDYRDGDQGLELLCSLLDRDASLTTALLQNHVLSIKAAWDSLLEFAIFKLRRDTFRVLTDIGFHNNWLHPELGIFGGCLICAIEMDCYDTLIKIMAECCASSLRHLWHYTGKGILVACRKGNVECARLLIQHYDINSRNLNSGIGSKKWSMFQVLIKEMESSTNEHALALDLFLANGADVDKKTTRAMIVQKWRKLVGQDELFGNELFDITQMTILDEVFYLNRSLFDKLRRHSRVPDSKVTRTGLLVALEDGPQTLRDYLSARGSVVPSFNWRYVQSLLKLLLAEQFTMSARVDMRIVRNLCEFDVDFTMPSVGIDLQDFWTIVYDERATFEPFTGVSRRARYLDFAWNNIADMNDRIRLLDVLLAKGGVTGELVLEGWVAQYGTGGLEELASYLPDFPTKAVRALARAARLNNFQAAEFLLRKGVDPNAFVTAFGQRYSIIPAIATQDYSLNHHYILPDGECSLEMIQLLVRHGTRLVVTPEDSTPFDFAEHLLKYSKLSDLLAKIKYVLGILMEDKVSPRLPSYLLETCFSGRIRVADWIEHDRVKQLEVFEYLFRQGAEVNPGSPLAALVYRGGRDALVRDVLNSGSDLDAYWNQDTQPECTPLQAAAHLGKETLVRLFLKEGANVNSPARGCFGFTALQGICIWQPATEEEHQRKMRICRLLIDQGANIHAAPSKNLGMPLGLAAQAGDLELAVLLLREGAEVNAPDRSGVLGFEFATALDKAAHYGRLDMVKFLLNANALSARRGSTGFDGAVSWAARGGYIAVRDLIREHAAKVEAGAIFNPEILEPQKDCRIYGFSSDEESSTDDDNELSPDSDAEDENAAGGTSGSTNT